MISLNRIAGKPLLHGEVMKKLIQHRLRSMSGERKSRGREPLPEWIPPSLPNPPHRPVWPNPPSCLPERGRSSTSSQTARNTRAMTNLGDAIPIPHRKRLISKVDEKDADLAPIIGIDRSRAVHHTDPVPDGKTAPGPHLAFEPFRNCHGDSGWDELPFSRDKNDFLLPNRQRDPSRKLPGSCIGGAAWNDPFSAV